MDDAAAILELLAVKGPLSTPEIADVLNQDRGAAADRLRALSADDKLESTAAEGTSLWWIADDIGVETASE